MIQKRVPRNKEYLVITTEAAIQGQVIVYSAKKGKDINEDDEK